ncbi:hypothetical protein SHJJP8921_001221 [Staphylococcus lugdunensis]|uniref:hypothetical protein n=1 Tax=Staphylococcus lugdunensis TaxID=28035 RepID=UPI001F4D1625|nr:hypothetical protein [Staphylococcus lugdunensis]MCH8646960.1 hypothetical protein [Staphylococcus lugdunensis]
MNKTWYKNNKYTLSYMIIFGVILSFIFGIPLGTGFGVAIGVSTGVALGQAKQVGVDTSTVKLTKPRKLKWLKLSSKKVCQSFSVLIKAESGHHYVLGYELNIGSS